jgi:C-terminal processing protease CtpA/Prc
MGRNAIATGLPNMQGKLGVGIIFRKDPYGLLHVLTIAKGSPAEGCGVISKGDVLMNVNGHPAVGMSLAQVKSAIVGPPGTPVKLILERPQGSSTFRFEVCLFRGHTKTGSKQLAPPTYAKHPNEDTRVWHEMSKIFSEVEELQQRRARAEKV